MRSAAARFEVFDLVRQLFNTLQLRTANAPNLLDK
jgi:hypothetical protein